MIDEFYLLYQYRKIQQAAATTDIKTLEQILVKFRKVVTERRAEYYAEIGEEAARKVKIEKMRDRSLQGKKLLGPDVLQSSQ